MTDLSKSKSTLARLLATENIIVTHSTSVKTACFDIKNRELICPIWKDMDGDLYDLLMSHEVGHALYTPEEGWHDAISNDDRPRFKTFLNVIEDARIERKIKETFPGLVRPHVAAYKGLYNRNFFGPLKETKLGKLNLIDRINIHFKLQFLFVPFSNEEMVFVNRVKAAETFQDVVDIANDVFAYMKENEKNKINSISDMQNCNSEFFEDEFDETDAEFDSIFDDEEFSDMFDDSSSKDSDNDGEESNEESETESELGSNRTDESNDDIGSVTDELFRAHEWTLVDTGASQLIRIKTNSNIDYKKVIVPFETVYEDYQIKTSGQYSNSTTEFEEYAYAEFMKKNRGYISMLVKEFEMRKNAHQYARALVSKSGELDMRNIAKYRFNNDIFRKVTQVDKGKSHGMIMFVDMSGSMRGENFKYAMSQATSLSIFCRKVNIPFAVYGFSDRNRTDENKFIKNIPADELNYNDYSMDHIRLVEFSNHKMKPSTFNQAIRLMMAFTVKYDYYKIISQMEPQSKYFELGNTPIIETVMIARKLINDFQKENRVDIMNTIFLTDGDGNTRFKIQSPYYNENIRIYNHGTSKVIVEDKDSGKSCEFKNVGYNSKSHQNMAFKMLKEFTNTRLFGFYISQRNNILSALRSFDSSVTNESRAFLNKNGYVGVSEPGFDEYYYVSVMSEYEYGKKSSKIKNKSADTKKKEERVIFDEFLLNVNKNYNQKMLVAKFAEKIAA